MSLPPGFEPALHAPLLRPAAVFLPPPEALVGRTLPPSKAGRGGSFEPTIEWLLP